MIMEIMREYAGFQLYYSRYETLIAHSTRTRVYAREQNNGRP